MKGGLGKEGGLGIGGRSIEGRDRDARHTNETKAISYPTNYLTDPV